jgi:copper chaperone NosL
MNKVLNAIASVMLIMAFGCKPEIRPIEYGQQACDYCRMSIVDERYAAQLVTNTGKAYSFDAIECMINYKHENSDNEWHMELVTDYNNPRKLIPAGDAVIVRSKQLPSPMGMYLTAVANKIEADKLLQNNSGEQYPYPQVATGLDNLPAL